ncbi:hypothetical protein MMC27_001619 [Xylographa pallens]|nr:hypothetical protein [Xylographa pallens]
MSVNNSDILSSHKLSVLVVSFLVYLIYEVVYRLYFSPISRFPGPRLAAASFWYEFYYDIVLGGRYTWKIAELHEKYGPVVRINPYELHINDPEFYDEIYVGPTKGKTDKWFWSARMFGIKHSSLTTLPHDLHRGRRAAYAQYFSKQNIRRLEPVIRSRVEKLCSRFKEAQKGGEPVNVRNAYSALTTDIISDYCFGSSFDLLGRADFAPEHYEAMISTTLPSHAFKQFGWLFPLLDSFPLWLTRLLNPGIYLVLQNRILYSKQIIDLKAQRRHNPKTVDAAAPRTIFEAMLDSSLPASEKSVERLTHEAQVFVPAGTLTTAHMLIHTTYEILDNKLVLGKLMEELQAASSGVSSHFTLNTLEHLPYLNAVIYEGLRISYGVAHRLQRIAPDRTIRFHEWTIPQGTPVGMTSVLMHNNPDVFPDPHKFIPERWLPIETEGQRLQKYLVAFSRGSRGCVGMNLANAEMLMTLATVFGRFGKEMRPWQTIRERDVEVSRDYFNPLPKKESNGIMIMIQDGQH